MVEIHKLWHQGVRKKSSFSFGHIEVEKNRVDHILKLRDLQDLTGGFNAFIPFSFPNRK